MADDKSPAPQHISSQIVPPGNHTPGSNQSLEKQMLELARREKEVRKMQESLKGSVPLDSLRERAKTDRNGLLKELGLDDLIPQDANDPVSALQKQIQEMQKQNELKERQAQEARDFEQLKSQLSQKPDDYEGIRALQYENLVHDKIREYHAEHGEMPDAYQIAKQLEDTIFEQVSSLKGTKKFASLFESAGKPAPQDKHPLDQSTTITSSDRTSTQQPTDNAPTMSRQQAIDAASKLIKFND